MKKFKTWKESLGTDPEWENLKYVWGTNRKSADPRLVNKLKLKIEGIKDELVREKQATDPRVRDFGDIPVPERDALAQAIVIAVLKSVYGDDVGTGRVLDTKMFGKIADKTVPTPPETETPAPSAWAG